MDYNVNAIICRPIYRGEERFREKVSKRQLRTGKSKIERNDPDKVQTRKSEHLRMVPDWLWYKANEVVDSRRVFKESYRGELHPLHGTSRDRHKLLSKVFVCGICGGLMHSHGRHNGSYRCANASRGTCWNRLSCERNRTHLALARAVVDAVLSPEGMQDAILARTRELHESGGKHEVELRRLEVRERKLRSQIEHLGHAVERSGGEITSLVKRLTERERDLAVVLSKRDDLVAYSREAAGDAHVDGLAGSGHARQHCGRNPRFLPIFGACRVPRPRMNAAFGAIDGYGALVLFGRKCMAPFLHRFGSALNHHMHLGELLEPSPVSPAWSPPADWLAFVQVRDDRDAIQASAYELPTIDSHSL